MRSQKLTCQCMWKSIFRAKTAASPGASFFAQRRAWNASDWCRSARDLGKEKNKRQSMTSPPVFSFPPSSASIERERRLGASQEQRCLRSEILERYNQVSRLDWTILKRCILCLQPRDKVAMLVHRRIMGKKLAMTTQWTKAIKANLFGLSMMKISRGRPSFMKSKKGMLWYRCS